MMKFIVLELLFPWRVRVGIGHAMKVVCLISFLSFLALTLLNMHTSYSTSWYEHEIVVKISRKTDDDLQSLTIKAVN